MGILKVSKSDFKPKAFAYLRRVEKGDQVCITDHGTPVADIVPHRLEVDRELAELRGLVLKYVDPTGPVDVAWDAST